jgi:hypothetical protein
MHALGAGSSTPTVVSAPEVKHESRELCAGDDPRRRADRLGGGERLRQRRRRRGGCSLRRRRLLSGRVRMLARRALPDQRHGWRQRGCRRSGGCGGGRRRWLGGWPVRAGLDLVRQRGRLHRSRIERGALREVRSRLRAGSILRGGRLHGFAPRLPAGPLSQGLLLRSRDRQVQPRLCGRLAMPAAWRLQHRDPRLRVRSRDSPLLREMRL